MSYCDIDEVKRYLGITEDSDDALIEQSILAAKTAIDAYCGLAFDVSDDSTKYFSSRDDGIWGAYLHLGRNRLAATPTSVSIAGTDVTSDIIPMPNERPITQLYLMSNAPQTWRDSGDDPAISISITGKWGYSTVAPTDIKQAAVIWAAFLYQQKDAFIDGTVASSSDERRTVIPGVPRGAIHLVAPYKRGW
jgi:hypothetical protein